MTDTIKMSDETAAKEFGADLREVTKEYTEAVEAADSVYTAATTQVWVPFNKVQDGLNSLFGAYSDTTTALTSLIRAQARPALDAKVEAAEQVRKLAIDAAKAKRDEALSDADPFAKFIEEYVVANYGRNSADAFINAMPLTFEGLKKLAEQQSWCTDFESVMQRAVNLGALPDDTAELHRSVRALDVPNRFGAHAGEQWVQVRTLPAFVRTENRDRYELDRWTRGDVTYQKVEEKAEEKVETPDTTNDSEF